MNKLTIFQQSKISQTILIRWFKKIVLLDLSELTERHLPDEEVKKNIYMIDNQNNIIWQIQAENTNFSRDGFTSIRKNENQEVIARRFSGFIYKISIETGEAKVIGWDK